ncbi:hypothetical protein HJG60_011010 [Phyllostomus discolor]|uniref:Uncharacterized protein n=1 Tax=Phyllostomus discolor TaxID=89673 RepID=A0A834AF19_9CHIR|nr:hypothetical protein HJG60_011010 [Phyllostomus discolor]
MTLVCSRPCRARDSGIGKPPQRGQESAPSFAAVLSDPFTSLGRCCFLASNEEYLCWKELLWELGEMMQKHCRSCRAFQMEVQNCGPGVTVRQGTWLRRPVPGLSPSPQPDSWVELLKSVWSAASLCFGCDSIPGASFRPPPPPHRKLQFYKVSR